MGSALESSIPLIVEKVFQYGFPGVLLIILLGAVGFFIWKIAIKLSDQTIKTLSSISETNSKFADSSSKIAELIKILADQTEANLDQLKFIKNNLNKQNYAAIELMNIIKTIPKLIDKEKDSSEIILRIDNVIKELQRTSE